MPRVKTTAHAAKGAKGKGKGKDMQDPFVSPAKMSSGFSVKSVPTPATPPHSKMKKINSGNDLGHQVSFQLSGSGDTVDVTTNPKSPRTPYNTQSGRANSASRELPRSSKHHQKGSQNVSSGGGKGKVTPLSARKHVVKTGKRFRPGTLALKEIKRL